MQNSTPWRLRQSAPYCSYSFYQDTPPLQISNAEDFQMLSVFANILTRRSRTAYKMFSSVLWVGQKVTNASLSNTSALPNYKQRFGRGGFS
jgi:hypothetical protein